MTILLLIPVLLSFLLAAAHFFRHGSLWLAAANLLVGLLVLVPRRWAARLLQGCLLLISLEWLRTLLFFVQERIQSEKPWLRLVLILGAVSLITAGSALLFETRALRRRYSQGVEPRKVKLEKP